MSCIITASSTHCPIKISRSKTELLCISRSLSPPKISQLTAHSVIFIYKQPIGHWILVFCNIFNYQGDGFEIAVTARAYCVEGPGFEEPRSHFSSS